MGKEKEALNLFLTENKEEALDIAKKLNEYNKERQETEKEIFEQAVKQVEEQKQEKQVLVLGSDGWHHGVIGIVASKITDLYFKPSVLICFEEEMGKGSRKKYSWF